MATKEGQWIDCPTKGCTEKLFVQVNFKGYIRCGKCGKVCEVESKDKEES